MSKENEPSWASPWGDGFPGWHLECTVMSTKYLGNQFDIHGGGMDLKFPHHECEIAQGKACNGIAPVRYWMHANMLTMNGQKMSKSRGNIINIFLPEKALKKQIMSIETDSTPLEEPKNPDTCNVFKLYELIATPEQTEDLRAKYLAGNFGYGHAKTELLNLILTKYQKERELFNYYMENIPELEEKLQEGANKTRLIARETLGKVRKSLGF